MIAMHLVTDADIERFIAEDVPFGDLTTRSLGLDMRACAMAFKAGADQTACCGEEAGRILARLGCRVHDIVPSGTKSPKGALLLRAEGPAGGILAGWKVAQTLMEYAGGIATGAAAIVAAARAVNPKAVVACTRKTFPGTKSIAIKAIVAGGAVAHRLGLSDSILVFPEHVALLEDGGLAGALGALRSHCPERKLVVEVTSTDEAEAAARAGADVVQLEKFPPAQVAEVVARLAPIKGVVVAAAGGVNGANAADYARAGAHVLVTSAPYWAKPVDVKVTIGPG
jgi:molybdenum transport protein